MGYKNPLLTEIYIELNLLGDGLGSSFVEIIPALKSLELTAVELAPIKQMSINAIGNADPTVLHENIPRVRVWNSEKTKLVQLSKNQIAVNLVGKYTGWSTFKSLFEGVMAEVSKSSKVRIESVMLATIDRAMLPAANFKAGDYLNTNGKIIPQYFAEAAEHSDIILGKGVAKISGQNRQFQVNLIPRGSHIEITIQSKLQNLINSTDKISEVLEKLHEEAVLDFENMITDKTRKEVMGGLV